MSRHTRAAWNLGVVAACLVLSPPLSAQERKAKATFEGHTEAVASLCFSPDGKTLASGGRQATHCSVRLWDVASGQNTATLKEEDPYFWGTVAFSPDGKMLATGGSWNKVKLWDVGTLKGKILLDERKQCPKTMVVFSSDGKYVASGGVCRSAMRLFDVATGKTTGTLEVDRHGVLTMAFTPDNQTLVSAAWTGEINRWDVATGKHTATLNIADQIEPAAFGMRIESAAFSADATSLAAATYDDNNVRLWEVAKGKEQAVLKGHAARVLSVAFGPDGKMLATGDENGSIKLWDLVNVKELVTLKGHTGGVSSLAFRADGKMLASGSADKTIKLWEVGKAR